MTKGKSTTYEERIALVREHIQPFAKFTHFCIRTHSVEHCGSFHTFRRGFRTFRTTCHTFHTDLCRSRYTSIRQRDDKEIRI